VSFAFFGFAGSRQRRKELARENVYPSNAFTRDRFRAGAEYHRGCTRL